MKTIVVFLSAICVLWSVQVFGVGFSETNNGIYLVVGGSVSTTNEPIKFDEKLVFMPFCNTGNVWLSYPSYDYCMKIKMFSPDGSEVPKTPKGQIIGSKFDQLHSFKDARLNGVGASGPYEGLLGQLLPHPNELFIMEKPGIYTLEIQMQMFRHTGSTDPEEQHRNLIRFSPIKIKVEKPPEAKANSSLNAQTNSPAK